MKKRSKNLFLNTHIKRKKTQPQTNKISHSSHQSLSIRTFNSASDAKEYYSHGDYYGTEVKVFGLEKGLKISI